MVHVIHKQTKPVYKLLGKVDGADVFLKYCPGTQDDAIIAEDMICDLGGNLTPKMSALMPRAYANSCAADWTDFIRFGLVWGFFKPFFS